jgi:hypothetical protein
MRTERILIAMIAGVALCVLAGCGGKYDKPLELDRTIRMGEYIYVPAFRGFENSVALSITGGSLYVAYCDTSATPPTGKVHAYYSNGARIPANLVADFAGLTRPTAIGAGKRAIAVADAADPITVKIYGLSGGSPTLSFSDPEWKSISGLAVDDTGNIYVCDAEENFVRSYKPNGKRRFEVDLADSGFGIGHVLRPTGLTLDGETLLISEGHAEKAQVQRIRIDQPQTGIPFSTENPYISVFTDADGNETPLVKPVGVGAGKEGSIFILDQGLGKIFRFNADGTSVTVVNTAESDGPTDLTSAVSIDTYNLGASASVYVLEASKGVVHRWDPKQ